jgi:hypothetical protein
MVELRLWKWQYTKENGEPAVSRWLMTEREAIRYRNAVRLQHTLQVRYLPEPGPTEPRTRAAPG